jgi:hypothetical protein
MSIGIFTDKSSKPSVDEMSEAVSASKANLKALLDVIEEKFKAKSEFKFYGKNYGWALNFRKSGKSLISIYPGDNMFTVQIILDKIQAVNAVNSDISEAIRDIINSTEEICEGKWIYIKVGPASEIKDIETLLKIRMKK